MTYFFMITVLHDQSEGDPLMDFAGSEPARY
jgi:hypothetical protein